MRDTIRWVLLCALVCVSGPSLAQSTNSGDIRGLVTDTTGALIPGTKVTVLNVDTGVSKDYFTNSEGIYDTSSIVAGNYKITFIREGFDQLVRGPITLQVGVTNVNAQLTVGSVAQKVVVSADVPLLRTESGEQSTTLDAVTLSQLPQVGQDWSSFDILLPGAAGVTPGSMGNTAQGTAGTGTSNGTMLAVNGNLPFSTVLADGAATTLPASANSDISVQETIQEVQISTSAFSAQYGIGGILYNQISKGGTDSFHGSAYEYFQNDALNANNYTFGANTPKPVLR
ncbi:MAG: carboxypeptidase-like regulatory domain-containing protein, partial [Alloacidobacterium sp.]